MGNFLKENNDFIMTSVIMLFGIISGWLTILKRRQGLLTFIFALIFDIITWFCYKNIYVEVYAVILSIIWIILCFRFFRQEEVSRRKIGKLIVQFTETADTNKPICIFGGDLNFFGDYLYSQEKKAFLRKNKNNNIETNEQFLQICNKGFREIKILSVKPYTDSSNDKKTRIRIGYIIEKLGERVEIKFFDNKICTSCEDYESCKKCENYNKDECLKLKKFCNGFCYNPDITLRGRIVTQKDTNAECVAIATTKEAGKKYILREYSSIAKECHLYKIIWDVWWLKCAFDKEFNEKCVTEYKEYASKQNKVPDKSLSKNKRKM